MILKNINIKEFKDKVYEQYIELFPKSEQKTYRLIKSSVERKITNILGIIENEEIVGFMMVNALKNNPYIQLDYLAIFPDYQGKNYGSKAIGLLQEKYKEYSGIFIEVEKPDLRINEAENQIRRRRIKFYERLGFLSLKFDLELFKVHYCAYILPCLKQKIEDEEVIEKIFEIYYAISGESRIKKNCKVILNIEN